MPRIAFLLLLLFACWVWKKDERKNGRKSCPRKSLGERIGQTRHVRQTGRLAGCLNNCLRWQHQPRKRKTRLLPAAIYYLEDACMHGRGNFCVIHLVHFFLLLFFLLSCPPSHFSSPYVDSSVSYIVSVHTKPRWLAASSNIFSLFISREKTHSWLTRTRRWYLAIKLIFNIDYCQKIIRENCFDF